MNKGWVPAFAGMTLLALVSPASAQDKPVPYWASIASGEAMTRTGPAKSYPGTWLYKRRDLPVRVLKRHESWRLIEDSDGARGWMLVTLLSDRRTALVRGSSPRPIHEQPTATSRIAYTAEPGVVARIEDCNAGWCRIEVGKRQGHIRIADIWGVSDGETVD
ncbi:SH3 domain-containing protein [Sphingomonas sp. GCM10030256]|uniref:SH3 domain-containing protein n=1 Tax=Sphingomonas sp. GCM10030256 TaxID=3273427 RepID=UPI0036084557